MLTILIDVRNHFLFRSVRLLCCLLLISYPCFSQRNANGFDTELLELYKDLIRKETAPATKPCSINTALSFDDQLKQALLFNQLGNWQCSQVLFNSFYKRQANLSPVELCHFHLFLAEYFISHQSYDSANVYAILANKEAGDKKLLEEKSRALLLLSTSGLKRRNISSAYSWADSALSIARQKSNDALEGKILFQLALCARRHFTSVAKRSFPYYVMARQKAIAASDSVTLCNIDIYLGVDNFELGKWSEGFPYFTEGIAISLRQNNANLAYAVYGTLGYSLTQRGYLPEALSVFRKALNLSLQQHQPYNSQIAYHQIADVYQALKNYDSALVYADRSGKVAGVDSFWANVYDLKASIYDEMGDTKMAAAMYKKSVDWFREDFFYRNQDQLSGYEAKLNTKEKELQVTQQKKRSQQLEWMIMGFGFLLVIAAWAYSVQRRAKRKLTMQKNIIEKQRSALEKSLGEKDILLKEIHHRVKNNLSVISSLLELQSSGIKDESARAAIAVGQNRVSSIALIHQRLYQHENLAAIELNGFLQDLFRQVSSIFKKPGTQIEMEANVPETLLDIDTAVPLGLIMNELLTNTFKYAFVEEKTVLVTIDLQKHSAGDYTLTYSDNGPGIAQEVNMKTTTSLGLRLIHRLSKQLGGTATYKYNNGTTFIVCFKDTFKRNQEA